MKDFIKKYLGVIALYVETVEEPAEVAEEPVEDEYPKKRKRS